MLTPLRSHSCSVFSPDLAESICLSILSCESNVISNKPLKKASNDASFPLSSRLIILVKKAIKNSSEKFDRSMATTQTVHLQQFPFVKVAPIDKVRMRTIFQKAHFFIALKDNK